MSQNDDWRFHGSSPSLPLLDGYRGRVLVLQGEDLLKLDLTAYLFDHLLANKDAVQKEDFVKLCEAVAVLLRELTSVPD